MTEDNKLKSSLVETNQKVEASLLTSIQEHVQNHSQKAGVDFLQVKNTLLLSYLIDLTLYLKNKLSGKPVDAANRQRLTEMKVVLDKTRGLDKKLRYQIDKLLQAENASTFATASAPENPNAPDDPLQYRPDPKAFGDDDDSSSSDEEDDDNSEKNDEDDDELQAAKRTMALARASSKKKKTHRENDNNNEDDVYKAPRHTAMPYMLDKEDKEAQREKRQRRKMRASELAQSLRSQYGDAPEQEDVHGGTEYGKQAQAARKFAERQAEKTKYEEDTMQRLTVTRKDKKEHKRLMRLEGSNLNGIADLGNLVRDASRVIEDTEGKKDKRESLRTERHFTGKRKKEAIDRDGRPLAKRKGGKVKNSYQAALLGGDVGGKKKKKSKR